MTNLLVTGASGQLGQRVLHHLIDTLGIPASRVVAASRKPGSLSAWVSRGVTAREADFDDDASLAQSFAGVKRLLIISTNALDGAGTRLRQHRAAVRAAATAGIEHVVYTSLPEAEHSLVSFAPDHAGTEKAIAESGIPGWTILRNHWYFENLFLTMPSALASGQWYSAAGDGRLAYIARDDLALAAATALADNFNGRRTLTLGGQVAYTTSEIGKLVSDATGKPLAVIDVPLEGLIQGMVASGVPTPVAEVFGSFDATAKAGLFEGGSGDFETLTGRKPQRLEDWLSHNADRLEASKAA